MECMAYPTLETFFMVFPPQMLLSMYALRSCPGDVQTRGKDCCYFRPLFSFPTALKATRCLITRSCTLSNGASRFVWWLENLSSFFAPVNPAGVCAMDTPVLKGNESRLSDWLLCLWPNMHPWINEVIVNSCFEYPLCARSAKGGPQFLLLAGGGEGGGFSWLKKIKTFAPGVCTWHHRQAQDRALNHSNITYSSQALFAVFTSIEQVIKLLSNILKAMKRGDEKKWVYPCQLFS